MSSRDLQRWQALGCPGRPRNYVISEIVEWARENAWATEEIAFDGVSEATKEAYLLARIEKLKRDTVLADFKIAQKNESLVDATEVESLLMHQAGLMRGSLEKLERKHGADALNIVLEALDELEAVDFSGVGKP
ncbi:MAG: hypothetical protein NTX48_08050 [Planctomycetales bacterium]|nr:hypothetical protein [Planctomycetales bacterium]